MQSNLSADTDSKRPEADAPATRAALEKILSSADFARSERLSTLLNYLVRETLEGRGERIKATSIAIDLYGRDESFDQQGDAIVRVEVGRLRRRLEKYYQGPGRHEPVVITIPKGRYQPTFLPGAQTAPDRPPVGTRTKPQTLLNRRGTLVMAILILALAAVLSAWMLITQPNHRRADVAPTAPAKNPFVLVMPVTTISSTVSDKQLAVGLVEALITKLANLSGLSVMAHASMLELNRGEEPPSIQTLRANLGATHVLRGRLAREDQTLVLSVQLIDTGNGETLWADRFSRPEGGILSLEEELAQRIVEKLSVAIHPEERKKLAQSRASSPEALVLYRQALVMMMPPNDMARILLARKLFQRVKKLDPAFAGGYAGESLSHSITVLFLKTEAPERELAIALPLAEKAISIDPEFGAGHAMLSLALIFSGNLDAAAVSARQGVKVQPGSAFTQFMLGLTMVLAGSPEEATVALNEAIRLDPAESRMPYRNVLGIALYAAGRNQASLDVLEDSIRRGGPEGPHMDIFRVAAHAQLGQDNAARNLLDDMAREYPRYDVKKWLAKWLVPNGRLEDTLEALGELGLK